MANRQKRAAPARDPLESLLGYNLRRLSVATMADFAESLRPLALKPAGASVLFVVGANPGITQSDAGRLLGVRRANMAPLVAALTKRDLLERERRDGRSQGLQLSAAGRALHRRAWKVATSHEDRLFGTLSRTARSRMLAHLRELWKSHASNDADAAAPDEAPTNE